MLDPKHLEDAKRKASLGCATTRALLEALRNATQTEQEKPAS